MPDSQPDTESENVEFRRRDFDDLHRSILEDATSDPRYNGAMSNALKTEYICRTLEYPQNVFDLDLPFPIEDWIQFDDQSLINCGLYLNDLRQQFYDAMIEKTGATKGELFLKQGSAEFWCYKFNAKTHQRLFGDLLIDQRILN